MLRKLVFVCFGRTKVVEFDWLVGVLAVRESWCYPLPRRALVCCFRALQSEEDTLLSPGGDAPAVVKIVMGSDAATSSAVRDESSPARAPPAEPTEPFAGPSDAENTEGVNGGEAHTVDVRLEELRPDAFALSEVSREQEVDEQRKRSSIWWSWRPRAASPASET